MESHPRTALAHSAEFAPNRLARTDQKLSAAQRAIIHIAANSNVGSRDDIAKLFGVSGPCVSQIKRGMWNSSGTAVYAISGVTRKPRV